MLSWYVLAWVIEPTKGDARVASTLETALEVEASIILFCFANRGSTSMVLLDMSYCGGQQKLSGGFLQR
jgi:hypothetical protein